MNWGKVKYYLTLVMACVVIISLSVSVYISTGDFIENQKILNAPDCTNGSYHGYCNYHNGIYTALIHCDENGCVDTNHLIDMTGEW
jgi:hypothetical protein